MLDSEIAEATADERRAVADWLVGLDEASLRTPSLCEGWEVRTVAAHLATSAAGGVLSFLGRAIRHGGPNRASDAMARKLAERPAAEIADVLRANARHHLSNPGMGPSGPLADVLVHTGDMRRPLGLPHDPDPARVAAVLSFLTAGRAFGFVPRGYLKRIRLIATDIDFSWGDGDEVRGRGADLMMAVCGRGAALADLDGPGVEPLEARHAGTR